MTETSPLGSLSTLRKEVAELPSDEQYEYRAKAGCPCRVCRSAYSTTTAAGGARRRRDDG